MTLSRLRRQTFDQNVIPEEEEHNSLIELDEEFGVASMAEEMQGSSQKEKESCNVLPPFGITLTWKWVPTKIE